MYRLVNSFQTNNGFSKTFSSLRHYNYRLFFFNQMVSLIGTWMQRAVEGWLIYELTGSKLLLGLITGVAALPILLFSLVGGAIADRFSKQKILIWTQILAAVLAFIMSYLIFTGKIQVWHIAVVAFCGGLIMAFDMPTRQAFTVEMVGKQDLLNAVSLNSSIFNAARIVGPAVAGWLMAKFGIAICYFLNGISFLPVIGALLLMKNLPKHEVKISNSIKEDIASGLKVVKDNSRIMGILGILSVIVVFGWSYAILLPVFAKDFFCVGAKEYGFLLSANGVGAILGSLFVAYLGDYPKKKKLLLSGIWIFCLTVILFSVYNNYYFGLMCLVGVGFGMMLFHATANTLVQTMVSDEYRGRVMSVWALIFGGLMPVGNFQAGFVAQHIGASGAVQLGAVVCILAAIFLLYVKNGAKPSNMKIGT